MINILKNYLEIVKPGIIFGNVILIIGGFIFASCHVIFNFFLFLYTILGASLVIASACVCNNLIDYDIDQKMKRTRGRALSRNIISFPSAIMLSFFLGMLGLCVLGILVNYISMFLSIFGFFIYVILYTLIYKRTSIYSTFIGSFAGSTPAVIGYVAVSNQIDVRAVLLFVILVFWQMSHFYSIAIFRYCDYKNANIPVFSVLKGVFLTKKHIFLYVLGFIFFSSLLTFLGYLSNIFLFLSSIVNFFWLFITYCSIKKRYLHINARQLFLYSIIVVVIFNILIVIDVMF